ncbi:MAG: GtrA family protein [Clostridia bacterium]|nr:GtrA family protein [Clostridia bacterium]
MINTIKSLIIKYKELITYGIFGVATTVVDFVTFKLAGMVLGESLYLLSNVIAWVVSVIFAYITNKLWVFESKSMKLEVVLKELLSFFAARGFSFIVSEAGLFLLVDAAGFSEYSLTVLGIGISGTMIAKILVAVVVVIINYFFSKLFIFKKDKKDKA